MPPPTKKINDTGESHNFREAVPRRQIDRAQKRERVGAERPDKEVDR